MSDSGFQPNKEQSLSRVDFHQAFNSGRMVDATGEPLTLSEALNVVRRSPNEWHETMGSWMQIKGFWSWFCRPPVLELSRMTGLLVESATNALYRILQCEDPKSFSAQVAAARSVLELANVMPDKKAEKVEVLDSVVRSMTDEQRTELVKKYLLSQQKKDEGE